MLNHHHYAQQLNALPSSQTRRLDAMIHNGVHVELSGKSLIDIASNDYLGLGGDKAFYQQFTQDFFANNPFAYGSTSSRLLSGNHQQYDELEKEAAQVFSLLAQQPRETLLFNSGYHANIGILPAICDKKTLILADKLVHASLIAGMQLSSAKWLRYRHQDMAHLEELLANNASDYQRIIIVTESLFSMDGDTCDLAALVALKKQYEQVLLYVDEAHSIGVYGEGYGLAAETHTLAHIDFLVCPLGKAMASQGALLVTSETMKSYLVNYSKSLIYTTGLPPINVAWSHAVFNALPSWQDKRERLMAYTQQVRQALADAKQSVLGNSFIIPWVLGDSENALSAANALQNQGFYAKAIRPPTVAKGSSRIRLSLSAGLEPSEVDKLCDVISSIDSL